MKKMIGMITLLLLMMGVVGCNGEKVNIDFPFEIGEVENIEMQKLRTYCSWNISSRSLPCM